MGVVSVLPPAQQTLTHVMKLAVDHTAPENDDEAVNHTALIADMKTEIDNLKKRTTEQAFGTFHSGVPVCALLRGQLSWTAMDRATTHKGRTDSETQIYWTV